MVDRRHRQPWLAAFDLQAAIDLLDLSGGWATRASAPMAIHSGPRPRAQRWARAIYEAYPRIHGIWFPSSMDGSRPAIALFERARQAMPEHPRLNRALAEPPLLTSIVNAAERFGYRVV